MRVLYGGFTVFLTLVALAVPGYFVRAGVVEARSTIAALRTLSANNAGPKGAGPVVLHGVVLGGAKRQPGGVNGGAAFSAHVGRWKRQGKSSYFALECTITRAENLRFEEDATKQTFTVTGYDFSAGDFPKGVPLVPRRVAVSFSRSSTSTSDAVTTSALPEVIRDACRQGFPRLGSPVPPLEYEEHFVLPGDELEVRGCVTGDTIAPCGDGLDFVTDGTLRNVKSDTRNENSSDVVGGAFALLAALAALGVVASRAIVRSSRVEATP